MVISNDYKNKQEDLHYSEEVAKALLHIVMQIKAIDWQKK